MKSISNFRNSNLPEALLLGSLIGLFVLALLVKQ